MIYLDNAATTFPKPECVYDRVNTVQRTIAVNVGRGSYSAATQAMQVVDETRELLADLVGASCPDHIVFTPSATIAANEIILGLDWNAYRNVYVTPFEHNAIARPLHRICQEHKVQMRLLPFDPETQRLNAEKMERQFASNPPDFVFLNQVSNVTGAVIPVDDIAKCAKKYDAVVTVDGSQSVGLLPINLKSSSIDYLIFAGHKNLYSSWGIGGFVKNSAHVLQSAIAGGTGSDSLNLKMSSETPYGYESGSPNIIAIASLNESLKWLKEQGIANIESKKKQLTRQLIDGLQSCGCTLYLPGDGVEHTSVVSFNLPDYEAGEVGTILSEDFDIAVRTGFHCAPFIHELLGTIATGGTVRASVSFFSEEEDVDTLIGAIRDIMGD